MTRLTLLMLLLCVSSGPLAARECIPWTDERTTEEFYFTAASSQGAVGDIVAVDISLTVDRLPAQLGNISAVACYDPTKAELLPEADYSEAFDQLFFMSNFLPLTGLEGERGFWLDGAVRRGALSSPIVEGEPLYLATVFFRLTGAPGDAVSIRFCDNVFGPEVGTCRLSMLIYNDDGAHVVARSTRHVAGEIRILEGEATQTEPPVLPPLAKVYPDAPTAETSDIRFDLAGAVVGPGATEVPLDLHITSNHEFSGFGVSLTFPAESLELARVEEHTRPGLMRIDNEAGGMGLFMANSHRRIAAEGERVRIATLYFNVRPEAGLGAELRATFEPWNVYVNWLGIRHTGGGLNGSELPVTAQVESVSVTAGILKIQEQPTRLGDVNADFELDLTDAVALLNSLFLGDALLCPAAADFNEDRSVNISDPVAILNFLFLGGPPAGDRQVFCNQR